MTQQQINIKKFLRNIAKGEYKAAHANLQTVVENKLKRKIVKASKSKLF